MVDCQIDAVEIRFEPRLHYQCPVHAVFQCVIALIEQSHLVRTDVDKISRVPHPFQPAVDLFPRTTNNKPDEVLQDRAAVETLQGCDPGIQVWVGRRKLLDNCQTRY